MNNLDRLIDVLASDVDTRPANWLVDNSMAPIRPTIGERNSRARFSSEDHQWLEENLQLLGAEECARILGRSLNSVHVHAVRAGMIHPRHAKGFLSGNMIASILGVDSHCPPCWIDRGILEGERFPYNPESQWKRRVKIVTFKRWLIHPESWVYFDVNKMTDPHLQRLVHLAQSKWGDEWWGLRRAADQLGTDPGSLRHYLIKHHLPAIRAVGMGREREQAWAYWFVPKSVVMQITWPRRGSPRLVFTERAMRFIVKARDEWGKSWLDIRRMMKTTATDWTISKKYSEFKRG